MGEGLAFVKLWPLDPKTGARSSSLKTGHSPPSIAELADRTSASMDIEILVGRAGLAAVAKAEAAAKAEEAAAMTKEAAATAAVAISAAPEAAEGAPAAVAPPDEGRETTTQSAEEGVVQHPSVPAVETMPGTVEADGTVDAATTTAATTTTSRAAPHWTSAGAAKADEHATVVEATAAPLPRKLALEVEVFAIGSINVPYLMALIKVSFEQVCVRGWFPLP